MSLARVIEKARSELRKSEAPAQPAKSETPAPKVHRVATGKGVGGEVPTLAQHGQYAIHKSKAGTFDVTHVPSGLRVGSDRDPRMADQRARHFAKSAPAVGKGAKLGDLAPADKAALETVAKSFARSDAAGAIAARAIVAGPDVIAKSAGVRRVGGNLYVDRGAVKAEMVTAAPGAPRPQAPQDVVVKSEAGPVWPGSRTANGRLVRPGSPLRSW